MTAVSLPAHDDGARETLPVLMSVPLRPGYNRADLSRYGDQTWDLSPGVFRDNARRCHVTVHFSSIEDPAIADALRQFLHARLNVDLLAIAPGFSRQRCGVRPTGLCFFQLREGRPWALRS